MPQFQTKLVYLGDQGMEFANNEGKQVKMLKTRWGSPGDIAIWDFNIMIIDEATQRLAEKCSNLQPYTPVDCLLNLTGSKELKPVVKLLDIPSNALKQKQ